MIGLVKRCAAVGLTALLAAGAVAAEKRTDFSGIWELADNDLVTWPELNNPKFTPEAKANLEHYRKNYDPVEGDPAQVCLLKGMPWTILNRARTYPFEVYQTEDRIVMFFELWDTYRDIRLDTDEFPEDAPSKANGYSIARFENGELVIETKGMPALNAIGPYQRSYEAHITERWKLRQDPKFGEVLDVRVVVDDPEIYEEPATAFAIYKRAAEGTVVGGYGCSEQLWDAFVDKAEEQLRAGNTAANNK
ncbi:MAG: hypothetical protein RBS88_07515 [Spongiibacteraceae bacterium]|jgi:hypothetical protein|nr:hypothetical protein [Spongiibacteraceae bacterium]